MPGPVTCPSCGSRVVAADGVCAACGFTVRRGAPLQAGATPSAAPAAARAALGWVVDAAVDGGGPAGWAPQAPSPPARISAPEPVTPPPSQIAVDGLEARWSDRFPSRPVRTAAAAAGAVAATTAARVAGGRSASASSRVAVRGSSGASSQIPTRGSSVTGELPGAVPQSAARARERQRELVGVSAAESAAAVRAPAGFDQVLGSDFRADSAISGANPRDAHPLVRPARAVAAVASTIAFPSWWRSSTPDAAGSPAVRPAPRSRPPLPRMGVVFGVLVLLFGALIAFTAVASHWSAQQQSGSVITPLEIAAPQSGDLVTVHRELARLAAVAASPAAQVKVPRPTAAARARAIRARLILWRDQFSLTAHQTRVLDHAIAYARASSRWLEAPQNSARHAAALRAWRVWRADDPVLRNP